MDDGPAWHCACYLDVRAQSALSYKCACCLSVYTCIYLLCELRTCICVHVGLGVSARMLL